MQQPTSRPDERRRLSRRRALLKGKIVYPRNTLSTDCTIKDISTGGARVSLGGETVSDGSYLIVVRDGVAHEATAAWRSADQVGLKFERSFDLTAEAPLHLRDAQRIWLELMPR